MVTALDLLKCALKGALADTERTDLPTGEIDEEHF